MVFIKWIKSVFNWNKTVKVEPIPAINKESEKEQEPVKPVHNPEWMNQAEADLGKKETDPAYNKSMSKKWSLFGMNLGTIKENWAAWCGLFVAASLAGAGISYQYTGALARNWGQYGSAIEWKQDGIPRGAIVWVNHSAKCSSSSSNHVAFANGDCAAADVTKSGSTIDLLGGNQQNMVKVSAYKTSTICSVRWPKEIEKPAKVLKSKNCNSKSYVKESTQ